MRHLADEDFIAYVSVSEIKEENMALIARVNSHIRQCEDCLTRLQAFQLVSREFDSFSRETELKLLTEEVRRERAAAIHPGEKIRLME